MGEGMKETSSTLVRPIDCFTYLKLLPSAVLAR